jgi:3'-phosphoadenosine 5'-phosphosulfate sulfotransferase (PAPS reductase)/FAD synthetase
MRADPYLIEGPAQISFSGGRSSGMMLCKIVEAHDGTLPDDVVVCFANTGKEREETLRFIDQVGEHLGVKVHWVEYAPAAEDATKLGRDADSWRRVSFETAARHGEPFAELVRRGNMVPTTFIRSCTSQLKIHPQRGIARELLGEDTDYQIVFGIRADEPRRVARAKLQQDRGENRALPLAEAGVGKLDVAAFWAAMPFDLELPNHDGVTVGSNCDLCFMKTTPQIIGQIRLDPARADWWAEQELRTGMLFRTDRPNYAALKIIALQPQLDFGEVTESALPCDCVD